MRIFCTANRGPFGNILHSTFYRVHAPYCVQSRKLSLEGGGGRREKWKKVHLVIEKRLRYVKIAHIHTSYYPSKDLLF